MRPPARRGHKGLRPGGKAELGKRADLKAESKGHGIESGRQNLEVGMRSEKGKGEVWKVC